MMAEYIERNDVIDALTSWADHSITDQESWHIRQVVGDLKSFPAADVNPVVHGHWIDLRDCSNSGTYCSNCNNKIFDHPGPHKKKLLNFCPNCGADMRGAI